MESEDLRKLDYEKTLEFIKQLTDIRFKLLALLPIATGTALGLASPDKNPIAGLFLGLFGFFVTIGIIFYNQRNTEIYEKQMTRATLLELRLKIPPVSKQDTCGGLVNGRPKGGTRRLFNIIEMKHDRGLAIIYSTVLAVWSYLVTASALTLSATIETIASTVVVLTVPIGVMVFFLIQLKNLNTPSTEVVNLQREIDQFNKENDTPDTKNGA